MNEIITKIRAEFCDYYDFAGSEGFYKVTTAADNYVIIEDTRTGSKFKIIVEEFIDN